MSDQCSNIKSATIRQFLWNSNVAKENANANYVRTKFADAHSSNNLTAASNVLNLTLEC